MKKTDVFNELRNEIEILRKRNQVIPWNVKEKILTAMGSEYSASYVAKLLGIHRTNLSKWRNDLDTHAENTEKIGEPSVITKNYGQLITNALFLLVFLLCEFFLITQSYLFQLDTIGESLNMAIIKALLSEIIPIVFSLALMHEQRKLIKVALLMGVMGSFILSGYSSCGWGIDKIKRDLHIYNQLNTTNKQLLTQSDKNSTLINFYQERKQSNGSVGWPLMVKELIVQNNVIQGKIHDVQDKIKQIGNPSIKSLNLFFDVALKLMIQICSIISISYVLHKKK